MVNRFNLAKENARVVVRFRPADLGLRGGPLRVEGARQRHARGEAACEVEMPARSHRLLKVTGR